MADKGADELSYHYEPRCKICTAEDLRGNPIRDKIDAYATKHTYKDVKSWLEDEWGISVALNNLRNHFHEHAPYVVQAKKYSSSTNKKLRGKIEKTVTESHEALKRIINAGDQMVKNWVEDGEGPKMPVSERLYVEALKEDGRLGTKTLIDAEFEQMEKALFIGDGKEGGDDDKDDDEKG